jgi:hypothetical protein
VNRDFEAFVDALALRRAWDAMAPDDRLRDPVKLIEQGLARNPFAMTLVDAALNAAPDWKTAVAVLDAFQRKYDDLLKDKQYALYKSTIRDLAHARIEKLPAPKPEEAPKLLEALERQGCVNGALLARSWRELGGDDEFVARCKKEIETYLASPERLKDKRAAQRCTTEINGWAKTVKGPAKKRWAEQLLASFVGKETLKLRGKETTDPALEALRKIAGVKPQAKK